MIRRARASDLQKLARAAAESAPPLTLTQLPPYAWTLWIDDQPAGMAGFAPVPGLVGVASLHGFVASKYRRRGWASRLLANLVAAPETRGTRQLIASVPDLHGPRGRFLSQKGFVFEHEEIQLRMDDLSNVSEPMLPPELAMDSLPEGSSVETFLGLFDASFSLHPWYQPYAGPAEVLAEMESSGTSPKDLLFLMVKGEPVGFAWLRHVDPATGEIEPIGVHPEFQGQGLGRLLLQVALVHLRAAGCLSARIGAWATNEVALQLYRSIGFRPVGQTIYLALDIQTIMPADG